MFQKTVLQRVCMLQFHLWHWGSLIVNNFETLRGKQQESMQNCTSNRYPYKTARWVRPLSLAVIICACESLLLESSMYYCICWRLTRAAGHLLSSPSHIGWNGNQFIPVFQTGLCHIWVWWIERMFSTQLLSFVDFMHSPNTKTYCMSSCIMEAWCSNLFDDCVQFVVHLSLQPLNDGSDDEDTLPSLRKPNLSCPPNMTILHLCKVCSGLLSSLLGEMIFLSLLSLNWKVFSWPSCICTFAWWLHWVLKCWHSVAQLYFS